MKIGVILSAFFVLLIIVTILITYEVPVPYTEIEYTYELYTFEPPSLVRTVQVRGGFLWLNEFTQAQYLITNTYHLAGKFHLNFTFDNGKEISYKEQDVDILAGQQKPIEETSPLAGISTVKLVITPPSAAIPHEVRKTRMEHLPQWALESIWHLIISIF